MTAPVLIWCIPILFYLSSVFLPVKSLFAAVAVCLIFPFQRYSASRTYRASIPFPAFKRLCNGHGEPVRERFLCCYHFPVVMPHRHLPLPKSFAGFREMPADHRNSISGTAPESAHCSRNFRGQVQHRNGRP